MKFFTKTDQPADVKCYKTLDLPDGTTAEIKIMKTDEELYGPVVPTGFKTSAMDIAIAKLIGANKDIDGKDKTRTEILISYIRDEPTIIKHAATTDLPSHNVIGQGQPTACLVAFRQNDEVRLGWSQVNRGGEPMPYSKDKARTCAILRGMKDSVTMTGKKFATNSKETPVPVSITKHLRKFTDRCTRYFKEDFTNYFPNYTK